MHDSLQNSALRKLRVRAGCSRVELARLAGVAPNTVLNAERGRAVDAQTQRALEGALGVVLQRETYARIGEARADVARAEVDLEAARARLDSAQEQHEQDVAQMRTAIHGLWDEQADDEATDAEAEVVAA